MPDVRLLLGDCIERMAEIEDGSVDAIVTDPPAGIAFMGKDWDAFGGRSNANAQSDREKANDARRGGRGNQPFAYSGSSMPKSRAERTAFIDFLTARMAEAYRIARPGTYALVWALPRTSHWTATAIEDAGWTIRDRISHMFGTGFPKSKSCLKPGGEDWWLAYKPGGKMAPLQIDACRIGAGETVRGGGGLNGGASSRHEGWKRKSHLCGKVSPQHTLGRWPANVVLDEAAAADLDAMSGQGTSPRGINSVGEGGQFGTDIYGDGKGRAIESPRGFGDSGGPSRFYYTSKASRADRGEGNHHPTVKSESLMRWLCRLITPPGGTILDPFMGSGSTGKVAALEGFGFIGIERDADYFQIAERRIAEARAAVPLFA